MKLNGETIYEKVQIDAKAYGETATAFNFKPLMQCNMLENTQLGLLYAKIFN